VEVAAIKSPYFSQELGGFGESSVLKEEPACKQGDYMSGSKVYRIVLPDRDPAWLAEDFSCGASGGCSYGYVLMYNAQDRKRFGCPS
jgi:hypothetical protein